MKEIKQTIYFSIIGNKRVIDKELMREEFERKLTNLEIENRKMRKANKELLKKFNKVFENSGLKVVDVNGEEVEDF